MEVRQLQARLRRNPSTELTTFEVIHDAAGWHVRAT